MSTREGQTHQRRYVRANADFPVTVIVPGHELVLDGEALDLSGGGMRVSTATDLPHGQTLVLRFALPGNDRQMLVRGRVVLSFYDASARRYAHGIAFTQYASVDGEEMARFIEAAQE